MSLPRVGLRALPAEFPALEEWEIPLDELPGDRPFSMARFTVAPGGRTPPDSHAVTEIWLLLDGRGTLHYGGVPHEVGAGDVVGFAPFVEHMLLADRGTPVSALSIWWRSS
ncbi:cupin domain-containing protein [Streptosporangium sp. NPDC000239]|uniref:Cupin domain-containing protein n=1 Tax=Streptosporangium jomthongense TaxID=1193683 RepID=A0ABV8EVR1_9ACTN